MSNSVEALLSSPRPTRANSPETRLWSSQSTRANSPQAWLWSSRPAQPTFPDTQLWSLRPTHLNLHEAQLWSPRSTPFNSHETQLWSPPSAENPAKQLRNLRLDPMFPRDGSASPDSFRLDPEGAKQWEIANGWDLQPAIRLRSQWSLNHMRNFSRPIHCGTTSSPLAQVEPNKSDSWSSSNRSEVYRIYGSESSESGSRSGSASSDTSEVSDIDMYNLRGKARRHALLSSRQSFPKLSEQRWSPQAQVPGTMARMSVDLPALRSHVSMDGGKTSFSSSFRQELAAARRQPTTSSGSSVGPAPTIFTRIRRSVVLKRSRLSMEQISRDPYTKSTGIVASRASLSALDEKRPAEWSASSHDTSEQSSNRGAKLKSKEIKPAPYSDSFKPPPKESANLKQKEISPTLYHDTLDPPPTKDVKLKKKIHTSLRHNISKLSLQESAKLKKSESHSTLSHLGTSKLSLHADVQLKKPETNPTLSHETIRASPKAVAKLKNKEIGSTSSGNPTSELSPRHSTTLKRMDMGSALSHHISKLSPQEIAKEIVKLNRKEINSTSYHTPTTELSPRQSATLKKMDIDPSLYHHITELSSKEIEKLRKNGFIPTLCQPTPELSPSGGVKLKRPEINPTLYLEWKTPGQKKSNWKLARCL